MKNVTKWCLAATLLLAPNAVLAAQDDTENTASNSSTVLETEDAPTDAPSLSPVSPTASDAQPSLSDEVAVVEPVATLPAIELTSGCDTGVVECGPCVVGCNPCIAVPPACGCQAIQPYSSIEFGTGCGGVSQAGFIQSGNVGCGQIGQVVFQDDIPSEAPAATPDASVIVVPSDAPSAAPAEVPIIVEGSVGADTVPQSVMAEGVVSEAPIYSGAIDTASPVYGSPAIYGSPAVESAVYPSTPSYESTIPSVNGQAPVYSATPVYGGTAVPSATGCVGCGTANYSAPVLNRGGMIRPRAVGRVRGAIGGRRLRRN